MYKELPDSLKEIAKVRLDNPEDSLEELGQKMVSPIGKSGVNHRLQAICKMAREEREKRRNG